MHLINLAIENWSDALILLIFVIGVIMAVSKWAQPLFSDKVSSAEKVAHVGRLLINLVPMAILYVTQAETGYGPGTGVIKRAFVIEKLYKLIPEQYRSLVTEENLDAVLEKALRIARELWAERGTEPLKPKAEGLLNSI